MTDPNAYSPRGVRERLAKAGAVLGIVAVGAMIVPGTANARERQPTETAAQASKAAKPRGEPHIGKPVRAAQSIGTAIAIGISGNRPVR